MTKASRPAKAAVAMVALIAGYLILSYPFMQIRVPPAGFGIPLGELLLIMVLLTSNIPKVLARMGANVVLFPFAVGLGATLPHCAALQETVQVTPFPDASFVTVAVTESSPVAMTAFDAAETETVIAGGGVITGELPPPQPVKIIARTSARSM